MQKKALIMLITLKYQSSLQLRTSLAKLLHDRIIEADKNFEISKNKQGVNIQNIQGHFANQKDKASTPNEKMDREYEQAIQRINSKRQQKYDKVFKITENQIHKIKTAQVSFHTYQTGKILKFIK